MMGVIPGRCVDEANDAAARRVSVDEENAAGPPTSPSAQVWPRFQIRKSRLWTLFCSRKQAAVAAASRRAFCIDLAARFAAESALVRTQSQTAYRRSSSKRRLCNAKRSIQSGTRSWLAALDCSTLRACRFQFVVDNVEHDRFHLDLWFAVRREFRQFASFLGITMMRRTACSTRSSRSTKSAASKVSAVISKKLHNRRVRTLKTCLMIFWAPLICEFE